MIHSTAIIDSNAIIGSNVEIGPYTIIGANVKIGNNTKIQNSCNINGNTDMGSGNIIYPFCSIGSDPQDLKYNNEKSYLIVGNNNTFREHCTVNRGTELGGLKTVIGKNSLFMVGVHIAHDCIIADATIMANQVTLGGHVIIDNNVVIGGLSAVHQFCRIGELAMIGGMSAVENDVIPYSLAIGNRAKITSLNIVGLKRAGYAKKSISKLNKIVKDLYLSNSIVNEAKKIIETEDHLIENLIKFISSDSSRGLCRYGK